MTRRSVLRRLGVPLALVAALVVAVDYGFYLAYVRRLSRADAPEKTGHLDPPPGVSAAELARVGWLRTDKASSFTQFSPQKPPGVVRVGCFGGSLTYGGGVNEVNDFPSRLQAVLAERGYEHVEVLNFGNPWYGVHQSFLLWESVGSRYELDCAVLGPSCFIFDRDARFNHSDDQRTYTLHARYVLDGDDVRLVEVAGASGEERTAAYYSFLPRMRYLRYDLQAPLFLRCLVREGRTLPNPFYYADDAEAEIQETWRRLLAKMASARLPVLVVEVRDTDSVALVRELGLEGLAAADLSWIDYDLFPYRSGGAGYHLTGTGNRVLAEQLAGLLTGGLEPPSVLYTESVRPAAAAVPLEPRPLRDYEHVGLEVAGRGVGVFSYRAPSNFRRTVDTNDFRRLGVSSLVAIQTSPSWLDGLFVPLDSEVGGSGEAPEASLELTRAGRTQVLPLGPAARPHPALGLAVVDLSGYLRSPPRLDARQRRWTARVSGTRGAASTVWGDGHAVLRLGETPVAELRYERMDHALSIRPLAQPVITVRGGPDAALVVGELPSEGMVSLVLVPPDGAPVRVPAARWVRRPAPFPEELAGVSEELGTAQLFRR